MASIDGRPRERNDEENLRGRRATMRNFIVGDKTRKNEEQDEGRVDAKRQEKRLRGRMQATTTDARRNVVENLEWKKKRRLRQEKKNWAWTRHWRRVPKSEVKLGNIYALT